ncbi:hypothetical protein [Williamsia sp. D3]|uniref:hypothetical protein n=1 Tax=Williamsia sp. D3 TaxID=1313067 RepID=UPI0003D2A153|nr:hypothetical protein [Williamsia sp. D3]ETD31509.1 hypothetical protein W823_19120 [Williamsia sp. D3]
MTTTQARYGNLADSVRKAGQAQLDRERMKAGQLLLDLQARCAEQLIDATITFIGGGRVRVTLYGVDWDLNVQEMGEDVSDVIDKALDELNRKGRS